MIQIFNEENCPKWIKNKCEKNTEAKNPVTEEHVIYEHYCYHMKKGVYTFYVVRQPIVTNESVFNFIHAIIKKDVNVLVS